MTAEELAEVFDAGEAAVSGVSLVRDPGLPPDLYGPAAVARALHAMAGKAREIAARGKAGDMIP